MPTVPSFTSVSVVAVAVVLLFACLGSHVKFAFATTLADYNVDCDTGVVSPRDSAAFPYNETYTSCGGVSCLCIDQVGPYNAYNCICCCASSTGGYIPASSTDNAPVQVEIETTVANTFSGFSTEFVKALAAALDIDPYRITNFFYKVIQSSKDRRFLSSGVLIDVSFQIQPSFNPADPTPLQIYSNLTAQYASPSSHFLNSPELGTVNTAFVLTASHVCLDGSSVSVGSACSSTLSASPSRDLMWVGVGVGVAIATGVMIVAVVVSIIVKRVTFPQNNPLSIFIPKYSSDVTKIGSDGPPITH